MKAVGDRDARGRPPETVSPAPMLKEQVAAVERFRALVGAEVAGRPVGAAMAADKRLAPDLQQQEPQAIDLKQAHQVDFDHRLTDPRPPFRTPACRNAAAQNGVTANAESRPTASSNFRLATRGEHPAPAQGAAASRPAARTRRSGASATRQHAAGNLEAMLELLVAGCARAVGQPTAQFTIVPPAPNPMQISLSLSIQGGEVMVRVRTALAIGQRHELQRALANLQHALRDRLGESARPRVLLDEDVLR